MFFHCREKFRRFAAEFCTLFTMFIFIDRLISHNKTVYLLLINNGYGNWPINISVCFFLFLFVSRNGIQFVALSQELIDCNVIQ